MLLSAHLRLGPGRAGRRRRRIGRGHRPRDRPGAPGRAGGDRRDPARRRRRGVGAGRRRGLPRSTRRRGQVGAIVNLEARGTGGPSLLFETVGLGRGRGAPLRRGGAAPGGKLAPLHRLPAAPQRHRTSPCSAASASRARTWPSSTAPSATTRRGTTSPTSTRARCSTRGRTRWRSCAGSPSRRRRRGGGGLVRPARARRGPLPGGVGTSAGARGRSSSPSRRRWPTSGAARTGAGRIALGVLAVPLGAGGGGRPRATAPGARSGSTRSSAPGWRLPGRSSRPSSSPGIAGAPPAGAPPRRPGAGRPACAAGIRSSVSPRARGARRDPARRVVPAPRAGARRRPGRAPGAVARRTWPSRRRPRHDARRGASCSSLRPGSSTRRSGTWPDRRWPRRSRSPPCRSRRSPRRCPVRARALAVALPAALGGGRARRRARPPGRRRRLARAAHRLLPPGRRHRPGAHPRQLRPRAGSPSRSAPRRPSRPRPGSRFGWGTLRPSFEAPAAPLPVAGPEVEVLEAARDGDVVRWRARLRSPRGASEIQVAIPPSVNVRSFTFDGMAGPRSRAQAGPLVRRLVGLPASRPAPGASRWRSRVAAPGPFEIVVADQSPGLPPAGGGRGGGAPALGGDAAGGGRDPLHPPCSDRGVTPRPSTPSSSSTRRAGARSPSARRAQVIEARALAEVVPALRAAEARRPGRTLGGGLRRLRGRAGLRPGPARPAGLRPARLVRGPRRPAPRAAAGFRRRAPRRRRPGDGRRRPRGRGGGDPGGRRRRRGLPGELHVPSPGPAGRRPARPLPAAARRAGIGGRRLRPGRLPRGDLGLARALPAAARRPGDRPAHEGNGAARALAGGGRGGAAPAPRPRRRTGPRTS